jgi:mannose-6-phosphate isomerase-like protein (cupin superfamily)
MELSKPPTEAVVLPAKYTSTNPSESFTDPQRGDLTWHTLFSQPSTPTSDLSAGVATCPPHTGCFRLHSHAQAEIYYILEGRGIVIIDGTEHPVEKHCALFIPKNAEHGVVNSTEDELKWLYVFATGAFTDIQYKFSHEVA